MLTAKENSIASLAGKAISFSILMMLVLLDGAYSMKYGLTRIIHMIPYQLTLL